jgi:hypothetical protein
MNKPLNIYGVKMTAALPEFPFGENPEGFTIVATPGDAVSAAELVLRKLAARRKGGEQPAVKSLQVDFLNTAQFYENQGTFAPVYEPGFTEKRAEGREGLIGIAEQLPAPVAG